MSDVALFWNDAGSFADLAVAQNDLATDDTLETAIFLSLFTDRRAEAGDKLPTPDTDPRGWWGDAVPVTPGDQWGSRLWLLDRSVTADDVLTRSAEYARESLQWLLDDKVASRVDVESGIWQKGVVGLTISVSRPTGSAVSFRYNYTWASQEARRS